MTPDEKIEKLRAERDKIAEKMMVALAANDMAIYHHYNRKFQKLDKKIRSIK